MRWRSRLAIGGILIGWMVVAQAGAFIAGQHEVALQQVFATNLRGSLFSGFLGLGGFLFSLKTFIVVKMKEGLYDSAYYQRTVQTANALRGKKYEEADLSGLYGPLRELASLLFTAIGLAIFTAVAQLTIGLIPDARAAAACLAFALGALSVLLFVLVTIRRNLRSWFDSLDKWATEHQAPDDGSREPRRKAS